MTRVFPLFALGLMVACSTTKESGDASSGSATIGTATDAPTSDGGASGGASGSATDSATDPPGGGTDATGGTGAPTSSSTTSTSGGSGGTFVQEPDAQSGNECDPRLQDCPEGEKCAAWADDGGSSWNANKCVPVTGAGQAGDPCLTEGGGVSGLDDCAKGMMCWDVNEEAMGVCVEFCGEDDSCPPMTECAVQNDGVLPICIPGCDPLLQDCPEGSGCYAIDGDNGNTICIPDASGDGGLDGDPCEYDNVCDPGLICIGGSAGCTAMWCCTPWCDLTASNSCPGMAQGEECVPHFADPPPGADDVGICVIPQ